MTSSNSASRPLADRVASLEALLFDLDGTLIDTVELILASSRHATELVLGEALPDDVLKHNIGMPLKAQMEEYAPGRSEELLAVYRAHNALVHDELICEYPGTEQALQALSDAGYRMGIVTSKSRPVAQRGIDRFELGRFFEVIVAFEDTTVHKPEAAPLLLAAEQLGVASDRCLYCGDSPHDMACGIAAGSLTAAALWGPFPERVLEPGPDYAIDSLSRLAALLGGDEREYRVSGH